MGRTRGECERGKSRGVFVPVDLEVEAAPATTGTQPCSIIGAATVVADTLRRGGPRSRVPGGAREPKAERDTSALQEVSVLGR